MIEMMFKIFYYLYLGSSPHCSCISISVAENFKNSNAVLIGIVVKVDTLKQFEKGLPKGTYRELHLATVKTINKLKGEVNMDLDFVVTGEGHGDCGLDFQLNTKYVFYTRKVDYTIIDSTNMVTLEFYKSNKSFLYTDICDRTTDSVDLEQKRIKQYLLQNRD